MYRLAAKSAKTVSILCFEKLHRQLKSESAVAEVVYSASKTAIRRLKCQCANHPASEEVVKHL